MSGITAFATAKQYEAVQKSKNMQSITTSEAEPKSWPDYWHVHYPNMLSEVTSYLMGLKLTW